MICPCCQREWNTDINNSCICGAVITKKAPKNLPKADAYLLLADVRAELNHLSNYINDSYVSQTLKECIKDLEKVSEHFS